MSGNIHFEPGAVAKAAARVFALQNEDAQTVLTHLRAMTVERTLGAEATDAQLRDLEGARRLVKHIETLIASGRMKP